MPDILPITPAEPDDVVQTLAFALLYRGRKRVNDAAELTARITAERLAAHLAASGFMIVRRPPTPLGPDLVYAPSVERVVRGDTTYLDTDAATG